MIPQAPRPSRPHPSLLPGAHDSRAGAMRFWPVRLRQWLGLAGQAGAVLAPVVLATLLALEHPGGLTALYPLQGAALGVALSGLARAPAYPALPIATWSGKGLGEAVLNRLFGSGG